MKPEHIKMRRFYCKRSRSTEINCSNFTYQRTSSISQLLHNVPFYKLLSSINSIQKRNELISAKDQNKRKLTYILSWCGASSESSSYSSLCIRILHIQELNKLACTKKKWVRCYTITLNRLTMKNLEKRMNIFVRVLLQNLTVWSEEDKLPGEFQSQSAY